MIDEPLYPIAVLIDELKNEDIQLRLNSIWRLSMIARALGEERTQKELIPFLSENNDDDDEVLLAMAEELGVFITMLAFWSMIGAQMREQDMVEYFIPLVKRLAAGEWFTARVSSCGLFHIAYSSAPEALKTELRTIYRQLCQDDMPMVSRSAATNLGIIATTVEAAHLKAEIMSIFEELTNDIIRPVIAIDATHLKSKTRGVLLVAVCKDGNEMIYPLSFGFANSECSKSWTWFLKQLHDVILHPELVLIVSDRHTGISNGMRAIFPNSAHVVCAYHLANNLKQHCKKQGDVIYHYYHAAYAYRVEKFDRVMAELKSIHPSIHPKVYDELLEA
ncbi:hypothetical protein LWI29_019109 [Acer saccharum]|uniref:MULE transposase domain-containing protein n=1 Tax=Acer saccharum TaxID=4024 RepID=A0AA39THL0_ACESA|nr:hypothetical protein LWI29_019109 [Acer saccharum]